MKSTLLASLLLLSCASVAGQAPGLGATQTHTDPLGFSYTLPGDWQTIDAQPGLPALRQQAAKDAASEGEKNAVACTQVALAARTGMPPSVILVVTLAFDCFGQTMKDGDLPAFASGTAEGLKKSWNIANPQFGAYTLGSHSAWIERATGTPIDDPGSQRTLEVVCAMLKKGAACWMVFATEDASLKVFEQAPVALDGDAPAALVPATAFQGKHS
jgi:hypothetical protein